MLFRSGGFDDRRGGYNDRGPPSRDDFGRGGGGGDFGGSSAGPSSRPRLNLSKRTAPPPLPPQEASKEGEEKDSGKPEPAKPKANPFGSASAVDTTKKLEELDIKMQKEKEEAKAAADAAKQKKEEEAAEAEAAKAKADAESAEAEAAPASDDADDDKKADDGDKADDADKKEGEEKKDGEKRERRERKQREPKVVNSRAAMLESAPAPTSGLSREVSFELHCIFVRIDCSVSICLFDLTVFRH